MAAGIATGFVRKLYRILDLESDAVISWDASGASFSIHDAAALNERVLPRYFRGRLVAFRQQLTDHGFEPLECEDDDPREAYRHPHFARGRPAQLSLIARVPKPKRRASGSGGGGGASALPPPPPPTNTPRLLTVTLSGVKRPNAVAPVPAAQPKRARSPAEPLLQVRPGNAYVIGRAASAAAAIEKESPPSANATAATTTSVNPLFSNEPDSAALAFARLAESGLLPHSSELPEPISYLARQSPNGGSASGLAAVATTTTVPQTRLSEPPMFSDDSFRSALFFLASASTTGVDPTANVAAAAAAAAAATPSDTKVGIGANGEMTVASNLLSMLLASSTTGASASVLTGGGGGWGSGAANPLFSDQSTAEDEDDQDSIWNLLVSASVDRTKSAIRDLESPQERLRVILAERELLEEQRKRLSRGEGLNVPAAAGGSLMTATSTQDTTTTTTTSVSKAAAAAAAALNPLFAKPSATTNPLFAKSSSSSVSSSSSTSSNPLFARPASSAIPTAQGTPGAPAAVKAEGSRPTNPLFAKTSASQNPLFAKPPASANPLFGAGAKPSLPVEDDLWRLLMSSSIDSFRRFNEFEV